MVKTGILLLLLHRHPATEWVVEFAIKAAVKQVLPLLLALLYFH